MYVLGISCYAHESSAALLKDGEIRWLIEEERLNRERHTWKFPKMAINYCLEKERIRFSDISNVAFFWKPIDELTGNIHHLLKFFPQSLNLINAGSAAKEIRLLQRIFRKQTIGFTLQKEFGLKFPPAVQFYEHHLCHAASAFLVSPFQDSAILTIDGRGESTTTMMAVGHGKKIKKILELHVPHSLGHLYAAITSYLGFKPFFDEWKVMGMSAYGKATYVSLFEDIVKLLPNGEFRLDLSYFSFHTHGQKHWISSKFIEDFGPPRLADMPYEQRHFDIAYGLQKMIEKTGVHLANALYERTRLDSICLAGGVVLNCLMNKKIIEETPFKNFFFQPISNDAGTSMGAGLLAYHKTSKAATKQMFDSIYLGPEFSDSEIEKVLLKQGVKYQRSSDICKDTAAHIAQGKIVGWFQGRMEAGPRALGCRSIAADPTRLDMKDKINSLVKKREFFRPFAPSILEEKVDQYFIMPKQQLSPYMILIGDVRPDKISVIPAVTHADHTARVHTVNRSANPIYWQLISEFEKITGVPVLLNTSFNEQEPIVCTPENAVNCFQRTAFDVLTIGNFIVQK
ncbi:MAG: carbamoyl transferase [Candidatus Omnitrophica bacterium]|nr:carbamoyl transferase [Candidatus Omnitrophota bacterium]